MVRVGVPENDEEEEETKCAVSEKTIDEREDDAVSTFSTMIVPFTCTPLGNDFVLDGHPRTLEPGTWVNSEFSIYPDLSVPWVRDICCYGSG